MTGGFIVLATMIAIGVGFSQLGINTTRENRFNNKNNK